MPGAEAPLINEALVPVDVEYTAEVRAVFLQQADERRRRTQRADRHGRAKAPGV